MQLEQLQALLESLNGASFASLDTVTVPTLKGGKANPFKDRLVKRCNGHRVILFQNKKSNGYENKVRRHLIKEGKNPDSFSLGALPWGERLPNSPIITNKGKYYLQVIFLKPANEIEYAASDTIEANGWIYFPGDNIPKDRIDGIDDKTGSEKQGLDDQVIVRTFALESIVALRAFKEELQ
jgi:hypothetical protein